MKIKFEEKYNTISFYVIVVFTVCLVIMTFITEIPDIFKYIGNILSVMSPIICGVVISYLINPLTSLIERHLKPLFIKPNDDELIIEVSELNNTDKYVLRKKQKLLRGVSVAISIIITILMLIAIVAMVLPELIRSISGLFDNLPYYLNNMYLQVSKFLENNGDIDDNLRTWFEEQFTSIQKELLSIFSNLKPQLENIMNVIRDSVYGLLGGVKNIGLGFIISIYLMFSKENFIAQIRKAMYAVFPKEMCEVLLTMGVKCNGVFSNFIVGTAVDSLIIGVTTFIVLSIMGMPYTVLISLIIGVTNMIPFFGPFIGAIPSAILVLLSEPKKVIAFVIFIIVLQQIDGNIINPKILGNKMGLSTFWIMFAILVFGGLFGFIGMLIGVPLFTLLYALVSSFIETRLKSKNLPMDKRYYGNMSITTDTCSFPEKEDYSDEDIDESQIPKRSSEIISKIREKSHVEIDIHSMVKKFKEKFTKRK